MRSIAVWMILRFSTNSDIVLKPLFGQNEGRDNRSVHSLYPSWLNWIYIFLILSFQFPESISERIWNQNFIILLFSRPSLSQRIFSMLRSSWIFDVLQTSAKTFLIPEKKNRRWTQGFHRPNHWGYKTGGREVEAHLWYYKETPTRGKVLMTLECFMKI